jgi:hypothetical protein
MKTRKILSVLLALTMMVVIFATPALGATQSLGRINTLGNTSIGWEGFFGEAAATHLVLEVEAAGFGDVHLVFQGNAAGWDMEMTILAADFAGAFDYSGTTYVVIDITKADGYSTYLASTEANDNWLNVGFWGSELINLNSVKNAWLTNASLNNAGAVAASDAVWLSKSDVFGSGGSSSGTTSGGTSSGGDKENAAGGGDLTMIALAVLAFALAAGASVFILRRVKA